MERERVQCMYMSMYWYLCYMCLGTWEPVYLRPLFRPSCVRRRFPFRRFVVRHLSLQLNAINSYLSGGTAGNRICATIQAASPNMKLMKI